MHLSSLFSKLLVAAQLVSLPSFAHGRSLPRDSSVYPLEPRQTCRLRTCDSESTVQEGGTDILQDEELNGQIEFLWIRVMGGGVALSITNGLDVHVHLTVSAFGGHFFQSEEVGAQGVTMIMKDAHWPIWHNQVVVLQLSYRFGDAKLTGKPSGIKPKKAGGKRNLSIDQSVQGEATENGSTDTPAKPHGSSTNVNAHPNPKGQQGTGINDKKPKTVGGGPACPGGCRSGTWRRECRQTCV
ncbi:hypothetical protein EG328_007099 [Venturia inaequalis]|uniref:Uncharacterized protein n=1 Tax=Venturia inaequalis TaxID=5025 RepID=A0A8H3VBM4_VENIN|nr:hypothetical protein EG328_007099 [Venturia inaequalis]KAE9989066.1 hypothetical protein EG327_003120 [Venturia inaequalis]RDI85692.1 hypothetical protein Vi05172_g4392 [Venturia inaequalis]